ncbi:SET-domain-containing protein [Mycena sanguinolenta]|uniref:SET-domain-containing protein n=1 Tax=Mycena sanguinolenta TaxID=230812 RepID=A0A8H6ZIJ5_9AGAR|nr:SET-domain-containing protein [Mycena sanguinolenta]
MADITLIFCYPDCENRPSKASITHKIDENFGNLFRHLEASWTMFGRQKEGSLAFSYNQRWLEDSETPQTAAMKEGDIINCVEVLRLTIIHPSASARMFTVDPADPSVTFSTLFGAYRTAAGTDLAQLCFRVHNMQLFDNDRIVETMRTLGRSNEDFVITAMPADFRFSFQEDRELSVASTTLSHLYLEPSRGTTPEVMLRELKTALHKIDAHWLSTLICSWPEPCPPQNDGEILSNFASYFMIWRDDNTERGRRQPADKFFADQINTIQSLEQLYNDWQAESVAAAKFHKSAQKTSTNSLKHAIQANAVRRMLREANMISILGRLIEAWNTHGIATISSGPGLPSDLQILRECYDITVEDQTVEHILVAQNGSPGSFGGSDTVVRGTPTDFPSPVESISPADFSKKTEQSPSRRESARLKSNKRQSLAPPAASSVIAVQETRAPGSQLRPATFAFEVHKTRREIIQHEWNTIAREAGAAEIEFVNEVDDEEVPQGISILFSYIERSYVYDIGIPRSTVLAGCRCRGKMGCRNARRCSCQSNLEGIPAYTSKGLFTFKSDSEIIECNSTCACPADCINRVAQFPRRLPVHVFKTLKRGWGVRVPVDLVRGRVVGLYTGLLIRREEADKLLGSRASYCFDLDVNEEPDEEPPENAYSVDAYGCGNWTRFINHSCNPNLQIISVVYDTAPEDNIPYLAFVATKNIPAFTELTIDYNPAHQTEFQLKKYREKAHTRRKKSKNQTRFNDIWDEAADFNQRMTLAAQLGMLATLFRS